MANYYNPGPNYGSSYGRTDPSFNYSGSDRIYISDRNPSHGMNGGSGQIYDYDRNSGYNKNPGYGNSNGYDRNPGYGTNSGYDRNSGYRQGFDEHVTRVASQYFQPGGGSNSRNYKEYGSMGPINYASNIGMSKPSHKAPTSEIGRTVHYIDEAARTVMPGSRVAETTSMIHTYVEKMEPVEPSKRYGSYNMFSRRSGSG